jgi:hypothetical protein
VGFLRSPLGLFAAIVVVGVVVIAVGLKELGGTSAASSLSATPLSSGQFAQLNEHACVSLRRQLTAATRKKPRTRVEATRSVRRVASILDGLNLELDGRVPPPSEVAPFRSFLGNVQSAERGMNQLDRLTETGQWQQAILLVRSQSWRDIGKRLVPSKVANVHCGRARSTDAILTAMAVRVSGGTSAAAYYFAKPLTLPQLVGALEHMCISSRAQLEQIVAQKPTSLDDAGTRIETLTSLLDGYLLDLRGLTPPPSLATAFEHVLNVIRLEDRYMHNLDELANTGQWGAAEHLVRSRAWQDLLDQLGPPVKPADIRCG